MALEIVGYIIYMFFIVKNNFVNIHIYIFLYKIILCEIDTFYITPYKMQFYLVNIAFSVYKCPLSFVFSAPLVR